jgi:hypothetical protein
MIKFKKELLSQLYNMSKSEFEIRRDELFSRWKKVKPEYDNRSEGRRFSLDGIQNFDAWKQSTPKILFLLKENRAAEEDWEPCWGINRDANPFSLNITRWRQLLIDSYQKKLKEPSYLKHELPDSVNDIAIIELKKVNEGKGSSNYNDIRNYVRNDRDFIKEQIELINPDIIFCCSTGDFYSDDIYGDEPWDRELIKDSRCGCYKHRNRLVIDFFHPSTRSGKREKELFDILNRMISNGRIFEKFNW